MVQLKFGNSYCCRCSGSCCLKYKKFRNNTLLRILSSPDPVIRNLLPVYQGTVCFVFSPITAFSNSSFSKFKLLQIQASSNSSFEKFWLFQILASKISLQIPASRNSSFFKFRLRKIQASKNSGFGKFWLQKILFLITESSLQTPLTFLVES